ncbi:MAG: hypothetical protein NTW50_05325 [Candidatus Berkelbacteria bacterium]|nr:hypothetical protein [Candidatus Berkelbacteria bacterium]
MSCQNLTKIITNIRKIYPTLDVAIKSSKPNIAFANQGKILVEINNFDQICPRFDEIFLDEISSDLFWLDFLEMTDDDPVLARQGNHLEVMAEKLSFLKKPGQSLTNRVANKFVASTENEYAAFNSLNLKIREVAAIFHEKAIRKTGYYSKHKLETTIRNFLCGLFFKIFYNGENIRLAGSEVRDFGEQWSFGEVTVEKSSGSLGSWQTGGNIIAENHIGSLGEAMWGGTIWCQNLGFSDEIEIGRNAGGGTVLIGGKNVVVDIHDSATRVLVMAENWSSFSDQNFRSFYYYDPNSDSFRRREGKGALSADVREPTTHTTALPWKQTQRYGLEILTTDKLPADEWRVNGGFLILKNIGQVTNIGRGMESGVIIIDDPAISLEEAKKRVSGEKRGGLVFYLDKRFEKSFYGMGKPRVVYCKLIRLA